MSSAPSEGLPDPDQLPPIKIRVQARKDGKIDTLRLGATRLKAGQGQLRLRLHEMLGDDPALAEKTEIELWIDPTLHVGQCCGFARR